MMLLLVHVAGEEEEERRAEEESSPCSHRIFPPAVSIEVHMLAPPRTAKLRTFLPSDATEGNILSAKPAKLKTTSACHVVAPVGSLNPMLASRTLSNVSACRPRLKQTFIYLPAFLSRMPHGAAITTDFNVTSVACSFCTSVLDIFKGLHHSPPVQP